MPTWLPCPCIAVPWKDLLVYNFSSSASALTVFEAHHNSQQRQRFQSHRTGHPQQPLGQPWFVWQRGIIPNCINCGKGASIVAGAAIIRSEGTSNVSQSKLRSWRIRQRNLSPFGNLRGDGELSNTQNLWQIIAEKTCTISLRLT